MTRKGCSNHPDAIQHSAGKFCIHCGRPLEELAVETCSQCGARKLGKFCPFCGYEHERLEAKLEQAARAGS